MIFDKSDYGYPIDVGGRKPEWLRDEDSDNFIWFDYSGNVNFHYPESWDDVKSIRLIRTHPWYDYDQAVAKLGIVLQYWSGGDRPPSDWNGSPVLFRNGTMGHPTDWEWFESDDDLIGYPIDISDDVGDVVGRFPIKTNVFESLTNLTAEDKQVVEHFVHLGLDQKDVLPIVAVLVRKRVAINILKSIAEREGETDFRLAQRDTWFGLHMIGENKVTNDNG